MEKMKTLFRNASIATVGLAVANVSFADSLIDETTKEVLTQAGTDGSSVAKLVIAAVAVLVGLALVIGAMRSVPARAWRCVRTSPARTRRPTTRCTTTPANTCRARTASSTRGPASKPCRRATNGCACAAAPAAWVRATCSSSAATRARTRTASTWWSAPSTGWSRNSTRPAAAGSARSSRASWTASMPARPTAPCRPLRCRSSVARRLRWWSGPRARRSGPTSTAG